MTDYKAKAAEYISSRKNKWSPTTLRSEQHRLTTLVPLMPLGPEALWSSLSHLKPYSRVTYFSRAIDFARWMDAALGKQYDDWRDANAQLFKHQYTPRKVGMTYEEAKKRILTIEEKAIKEKALQLLGSAQRWSESIQEGEVVVGKGGKQRSNLSTWTLDGQNGCSYWGCYRKLRQLGLSPHLLRKLALTRAAENGATSADLVAIAGWSSIQTASYYLQPKEDERLKALLR